MSVFVATSCANVGLALFVWWTGERGRVWLAARAGAVLTILMLLAYWLPEWLVSQRAYHWLVLGTDLVSSMVDLAVAAGLALDLAHCIPTPATLLLIVAIAWHQTVKLLWHWAADLFSVPHGIDWMLIPARVGASWLVLVMMATVAYLGDGATRAEETDCDEQG